jgi:hypothetical protein
MSRIKVELITENGPVNYYFVDHAAAVAFANFSEEHATVINHHGQAVHVSSATEAIVEAVVEPKAEAAEVIEPVVEVTVDAEAAVVIEPVVEVTVDAEEVVELDANTTVKKSRKKKEE